MKHFMKIILGQSYISTTTTTTKLPQTTQIKDKNGLQDLAHLGKKTWEMKRQKYIHVLGINEK